MAAKIPVQVHIGITSTPVPEGRVYSEIRVTVTELGSGTYHQASIHRDQVPVPDAAGKPHFVVRFPAVQSGEALRVDVQCLDPDDVLIGTPMSHSATLDEVPDDATPGWYPQPFSIFLTA